MIKSNRIEKSYFRIEQRLSFATKRWVSIKTAKSISKAYRKLSATSKLPTTSLILPNPFRPDPTYFNYLKSMTQPAHAPVALLKLSHASDVIFPYNIFAHKSAKIRLQSFTAF